MSEPVLLVEDRGAVRVLTMNRPAKLNALDLALTEGLCDALEAADADASVRALVLAGAGRAFCAGADTGEFKDLKPENTHLVERRALLTQRVQSLPRQISKPIVSAVQGIAVGGGAGLALGCDMMVAAADLRFGYPELKHGLVPALVMTGLSRHLGLKLAFELVSTSRLLSGEELGELRLANRVVAADAVLATALEIAERWAASPAQAMAESKALLYRVSELPFDDAMDAGRQSNVKMRGFTG